MKELVFDKQHDLSQLHDELLSALPSLAESANGYPPLRLAGDGQLLVIKVDESVDLLRVEQVVEAHIPRPKEEPLNKQDLLEQIIVWLASRTDAPFWLKEASAKLGR